MFSLRQLPHAKTATASPLSVGLWLLPLGSVLTLLGYVGPWVQHQAAGLVITGLDLSEYVKFLHPIQSGEIYVWRQGFYLPLVAVSTILSLHAYRHELRYPWPFRIALLCLAGMAALNMLPPAWSPALLLTPEFRVQSSAMIVCLGFAAISPLLALVPRILTVTSALAVGFAALIVPLVSFLHVLPAVNAIYNQNVSLGWSLWVMEIGLIILLVAVVIEKDKLA